MVWEKVGVTIVGKPLSTSGGLYVRIPKRVVDAYELHTGLDIEVTVDRVKRPDEGNVTTSDKSRVSKKKQEEEE